MSAALERLDAIDTRPSCEACEGGGQAAGAPLAQQARLRVEGVSLEYRGERGPIRATHRVGFDVLPSERFVLLGASGCGKSSLLKAVGGFMSPVIGGLLARIHHSGGEMASWRYAFLAMAVMAAISVAITLSAAQNSSSPQGRSLDWPGQITIAVAATPPSGPQRVVVRITDTGPGVPVEIRGKIFDPFFTTKDVGAGTGLGLTISESIVRNHGGKLTVEGGPGEGATFVIELPVRRADRDQDAARR